MLLLSHIFEQLFFRISNFLHHWYLNSLFNIYHRAILLLQIIDRYVAMRISARYLFTPMYGDRSASGYIFGFIFRIIRISIGFIAYVAIICTALAFYVAWAALPILIIMWGMNL